MAENTRIAWTDHTANIWLGCVKVSEGCKHCYAETLTTNRMGLKVWGLTAPRQPVKGIWSNLRSWQRAAASGAHGHLGVVDGKTPHLVFTGSLMDWAEARSDLDPLRARMWESIRSSPDLIFQMLTKRPENIPNCLPPDWGAGYPNVWLGTTLEDNRVKDRAPLLVRNPAVVHFLSYEPAIGPIDDVDLTHIDWIICGGESGPGYRPLDMQWARDVRDRCVPRGTAFFMKQGSAYRTEIDPFLVEPDGSRWAWKQYPVAGHLTPPVRM